MDYSYDIELINVCFVSLEIVLKVVSKWV